MYIYANLINGLSLCSKNEYKLIAIDCCTFEDADNEIKKVTEENFEILLKIDCEIYAQLKAEYGF